MNSDSLFIVLGWDPAAEHAVQKLLCFGRQVVIVDVTAPKGAPQDAQFVAGVPDDPEALKRAGVERAAGLLSCLSAARETPALLQARRLNPRVRLMSDPMRCAR